MSNKEIAAQLTLISKLMELHGENSFKTRAYSQAAYRIEKLEEQITLALLEERDIPGIGKSIKDILFQILKGEKIPVLEELMKATPEGVIEMFAIKGLGPKKLRLIWKELEIESMGELAYACEENRLISLKGFGEKTQANVLNNIRFLEQQKGWYLYAEAWEIHQSLVQEVEDFKHQWIAVGDFAMQEVTLQHIHYIGTEDLEPISTKISSLFDIENIVKEEGKTTFQIKQQPNIIIQQVEKEQLGIHIIKEGSTDDWWTSLEEKHTIPSKATDEDTFWSAINTTAIPAYLRRGDFRESLETKARDIIQLKDIKGIIHSHSTYSDGQHSIKDMALAAIERGYEYLVMSDHSRSAFYANGLSIERIQEQHQEIDRLNKELAPFKIFKSIESDILYDGSLDYPDEILVSFDLVIASVHSHLKMDEEKTMERLMTAIENPYTHILGHPTGRLLLSRPGYPLRMEEILAHCKKHHVVVEHNAHPRRLDLDWTWIQKAQDLGLTLSINPDAHSINGIDLIQFGVKAAQRGGLLSKNNLSSLSLKEFEAFLADIKNKKH